jgi:phosphatidyl-myo-inositol dimannoside synthase
MARPRLLLGLTGLRIDGGIASVARCVTRALDELTADGRLERADRVLLLDDPAAPPTPPQRGEQRLAQGSHVRFVWEFCRSSQGYRPDLLFFDQLGPARVSALPWPGLGAPSAIFLHGIELDRVGRGSRRRALRAAWRLLVNSEFTKSTVLRRFPEVAGRVRVVPLCIDPDRVEAWEAMERDLAGLAREQVALIVGRMWSEERGKGHDELLEAWAVVRQRLPTAQLWIAGGGDDRARLEVKARDLGLTDLVHFLGRVTDEELARLFRRAAVFAMPSRQEGFGLVYAEAMWHGLPCIGATVDAAGEVIADGETGLLVPYGDVPSLAEALTVLLADAGRRERLSEASRRRAREKFGYPRFRADLLRALELGGDR